MSPFLDAAAPGPLLAVALAVVGLALFVGLFCAALLAHHVLSERHRRRHEQRVAAASLLLAPRIIDQQGLPEAWREARRRFGDRAVAEVLRRARRELRGRLTIELAELLEGMGEVDRLIRAARSRRTWRRVAAIRTLGECGGERVRARLAEACGDREPEVRRAARDGLLADAGPEALAVAIASYLADQARGSGWKDTFYGQLAWIAPQALRQLLVDRALEATEEKRALEALADAGDVASLPLARSRLWSIDPELRASAARFAGKLCDQESIGRLTDLLADPSWSVRVCAAGAVGRLRADGRTRQALARLLIDPVWWVRATAARALGGQGEAGAQLLLDVVAGEDRFARDAALVVLSTLAPMESVLRRSRGMLQRRPDDRLLANLVARFDAVEARA